MPPPTETIWSGVFDILEIPGAEVVEEASTITSTVTLEGPWASCMESRPRVGETLADANGIRYPGIIRKTVLHHLEGDVGQIVCTLVDETKTTDKQLGPTRYEVRYETYQKALEQHPVFNGGDSEFQALPSGKMSDEVTVEFDQTTDATEEMRETATRLFGGTQTQAGITLGQLVQLLKSGTPAERACIYKFVKPQQAGNPQAFLKTFFKKWDAGIEAYEEEYPIATKTTPYSHPQKPGKTNIINTPEGFGDALPAGYKWFKTTDASTWTGHGGACENTQSWKGLKYIDPDLYKSG